jgi:hypothetical protein
MSKLLRLRHAVLEASGDQKALLLLLEQSASAMLVLLRATLRLAGTEPPNDSETVCDRFASQSGRDASSLKRIVRHNRGLETLSQRDASGLVEQYLGFAEALVAYLDAYSQTVGSDGGYPA